MLLIIPYAYPTPQLCFSFKTLSFVCTFVIAELFAGGLQRWDFYQIHLLQLAAESEQVVSLVKRSYFRSWIFFCETKTTRRLSH